MENMAYQNQQLHIEGVSIKEIIEQQGTPSFLYSKAKIEGNFHQFYDAIRKERDRVCYAVKANSNLSILKVLADQGAGFDVVSEGELARVIRAGGDPKKIVFSGIGKTIREIQYAMEMGISCFNVESEPELYRINQVAKELNRKAPISIRVNPDVNVETHPYISTGLKENKFGVDMVNAEALYTIAHELEHIDVKGIDCHIGSQILDISPFLEAIHLLLSLVDKVGQKGIHLSHINVGGGLGVAHNDESFVLPRDYVKAVTEIVEKHGELNITYEPGRSILANAGMLVTQVEYIKKSPVKNFAIIDAAMNDLLRPVLYGAWHNVIPVQQQNLASATYDIVGPICESSDCLAKERELSIEEGSLLAILSSGAYSACMSSNYNSRPRAAEVLIDGKEARLITKRENLEDLWRNETL